MERVVASLLLALAACGGGADEVPAPRTLGAAEVLSATSPEGFARADRPRAFAFPADHAPHPEFQSEWWYATGHLETEDGARFGYQVTLFRRALRPPGPRRTGSAWETGAVWMGHAALLEVERGRFHAVERFEREALGLAGASSDPLTLRVADWTLTGTGDDLFPLRVQVGDAAFALDLELTPDKPLVLQGQAGWSRKGEEPGNSSYYYSATRMATRGTLRAGERELAVTGSSWLDREWSTSVLDEGQVGWDWFAVQLDDGRELMLYRLRQADGGVSPWSSGTLVARDGSARHLALDEASIEDLARWTSPETGTTYPARWRLSVPDEGLELEVVPYAADAELRLAIRYWEGPAEVRDGSGRPVGRAYVELVGYGEGRR